MIKNSKMMAAFNADSVRFPLAKRNLKSGDVIGLRKKLPRKSRIPSYFYRFARTISRCGERALVSRLRYRIFHKHVIMITSR